MTYNEILKDFSEKFAIYLGVMIDRKTKDQYVGYNEKNVEMYTLVEHLTDDTNSNIHNLCSLFAEKERAEDITNDKPFKFLGLAELDGGKTAAMFQVNEFIFRNYKFDENLMSSMKTVNKFNL